MVDIPAPVELLCGACRIPVDGVGLPTEENNRHALWNCSMQYDLYNETIACRLIGA